MTGRTNQELASVRYFVIFLSSFSETLLGSQDNPKYSPNSYDVTLRRTLVVLKVQPQTETLFTRRSIYNAMWRAWVLLHVQALARFTKEDPTLRVHTDQESQQTIVSGMGELHLDVYVERLR